MYVYTIRKLKSSSAKSKKKDPCFFTIYGEILNSLVYFLYMYIRTYICTYASSLIHTLVDIKIYMPLKATLEQAFNAQKPKNKPICQKTDFNSKQQKKNPYMYVPYT